MKGKQDRLWDEVYDAQAQVVRAQSAVRSLQWQLKDAKKLVETRLTELGECIDRAHSGVSKRPLLDDVDQLTEESGS